VPANFRRLRLCKLVRCSCGVVPPTASRDHSPAQQSAPRHNCSHRSQLAQASMQDVIDCVQAATGLAELPADALSALALQCTEGRTVNGGPSASQLCLTTLFFFNPCSWERCMQVQQLTLTCKSLAQALGGEAGLLAMWLRRHRPTTCLIHAASTQHTELAAALILQQGSSMQAAGVRIRPDDLAEGAPRHPKACHAAWTGHCLFDL
jgi:hypothetical protein